MLDANRGTTERVLDAAIAAGVPRIVYVSTVNVFGNTQGRVVDETFRRDPADGYVSYYDETKWLAHVAAEERDRRRRPDRHRAAEPGLRTRRPLARRRAVPAGVRRARCRSSALGGVGLGLVHVDDLAAGIAAGARPRPDRPSRTSSPATNMRLRDALRDRGAGRRAPPATAGRSRTASCASARRSARTWAACSASRRTCARSSAPRSASRTGRRSARGRRPSSASRPRPRDRASPTSSALAGGRRPPGLTGLHSGHGARAPDVHPARAGRRPRRAGHGGAATTARTCRSPSAAARPGIPAADGSVALRRHPDWIRARMPSGENYHDLKGLLRGLSLNTVCEEAHCPNIGECWDQRTATIMILGDTCTRACGFCAVKTGRPDLVRRRRAAPGRRGGRPACASSTWSSPASPATTCPTAARGSSPRPSPRCASARPGMGIEVLIPDFDGSDDRLRTVMDARPDILNHNLETVKRLQKPVRKRARWDRSLYVLRRAKEMAVEIGYPVHTKSSLMVGLGETRDELTEAFEALRANDVDILTIGQYLRPSLQHLPLERYYHPDEFAEMKVEALALGFKHVESAPLVRSSYHARDQVPGAELKRLRRQATLDAEGRVVPLAG